MEFLTTSQAGEWFDIAASTVRVWAHRGRISPLRDPAGNVIRHPETGERVYRLIDLAKAEHATRKRARR